MIFLNSIAMIALSAVAVPIIIHLRRRRKSKVVDWAAMQFLSHSLVNRRGGLALEHLLLLLCRCLLIVLFVLAMARPQLTTASAVQWFIVSTIGLLGLMALAWAVVINSETWKRLVTAAVALTLIAMSVATASMGNQSLLQRDQPRDIAIVIDASSSMKVEVDGTSNFHRAIEEARQLVDSLPGGSTVSTLVSGPVTDSSSSTQLKNLRRAADELSELDVIGGGSDLYQAIEQSRLVLEKAPNSQKQVVVFSDNQLRPWQQFADEAELEPESDARVKGEETDPRADAGTQSIANVETANEIEVFCRALPLPERFQDIAVTGLELNVGTVSIHRPVRLVAELLNGGAVDGSNLTLELMVNDKVVQVETVQELPTNSRTEVHFQHAFDQQGWNTVSVRLLEKDGLSDNDVFHHVVYVVADVPVLIVNGDSVNPSFRRPATFLQLALDPKSFHAQEDADDQTSRLTQVDAIDAAEIPHVTSFFDYQVVVLCDVPRLPSDVADRLIRFVERGGSVWVLPGKRCQPDFYNAWTSESAGKPVLPMKMLDRMIRDPNDGRSLGIDFDSVSHVTLDPLLESGQHDLFELQVLAHWKLGDWSFDHPKHVAARLTNRDPFMVEHTIGRGRVLVSALSLDRLESNLIRCVSFPVLSHLFVEHLATNDDIDGNHRPHRNLIVQLNANDAPINQPSSLLSPDGAQRPVMKTVSQQDGQLSVDVGRAASPGLYRLAFETRPSTAIPFTVLCDQDEFDLTAASDRKLDELGQTSGIQWIADVDEVEKIARGSTGKIELWKYCAVAALVMIVIEVIVMHWVAWRRGAPSRGNVDTEQPMPVSLPWQTTHRNDVEVAWDRNNALPRSADSTPPPVEAIR